MSEEISLTFLINNGVAVGVAFYVLSRINPTLKDLTDAINNLNKDTNKRLDSLENNERQTQLQLHELKLQVDNLKRGDG